MPFKSLLESSRLEVIGSKRAVAFIYLLFGTAILAWWSIGLFQFFDAYFTYGQFDGTPFDFMMVTLLFFLPLLLVGSLLLQSFFLRERLLRWLKTRTVHAQYASGLSPAEAGMLVDYEYSLEETWATLLDLHFRGAIELAADEKVIFVTRKQAVPLSDYESRLLRQLLTHHHGSFVLHGLHDKNLVEAGHAAHSELIANLEKFGALRVKAYRGKWARKIIIAVYYVAGFTALLQLTGAVFGGDQYWGINYPRYDINFIQPLSLIAMTVFALAVILSAFKPDFSKGSRTPPEMLHLQAAGYYEYLKRVYTDRLSLQSFHTQTPEEIRTLVPYMIAFKHLPLDIDYIKHVISQ